MRDILRAAALALPRGTKPAAATTEEHCRGCIFLKFVGTTSSPQHTKVLVVGCEGYIKSKFIKNKIFN